jgi:hypothetical protein
VNFFQNITVNNGWAMAITGAIIVMTGLSVLATIISQLHRIIAFLDRRKNSGTRQDIAPPPQKAKAEVDILNDPAAAARIFSPLTAAIGDSFELRQLYEIFRQERIAHPHLTIRTLRDCGFLLKSERGLYYWKTESY